MPPCIYVVGSAMLDLVFRTPRFPRPGESVIGDGFATFAGGKGANQAMAIARLGGDVRYVGMIGADPEGEVLRESLTEGGVDISHLAVHPSAHTGVAGITIDATGMNEIVVAPGANMKLPGDHVRKALKGAGEAIVLSQLETSMESVEAASETSGKFFLNPAPSREVSDDILGRAYAVTPNESEAEFLTGIRPEDLETCRAAAAALLAKGAENVVLTLGERGCFWMDRESELFVAAPKVEAVDTVGAGDAFNGALVYFLNLGHEWPKALEMANRVAAISVTRHGAQASMPTLAEVSGF